MEFVAPVVLDAEASRYRKSAASPRDAPSTIPVARSRPRGRRIPIDSSGSDVEYHESEEGRYAEQERGGAPGGADVGKGVPGERLAANDRKRADQRRDHGHYGTNRQCHTHRIAGEESRFKER